jgi:hypothetical protein
MVFWGVGVPHTLQLRLTESPPGPSLVSEEWRGGGEEGSGWAVGFAWLEAPPKDAVEETQLQKGKGTQHSRAGRELVRYPEKLAAVHIFAAMGARTC